MLVSSPYIQGVVVVVVLGGGVKHTAPVMQSREAESGASVREKPSKEEQDASSVPSFAALGVCAPLCEATQRLGWTAPSAIQCEALPHALQGARSLIPFPLPGLPVFRSVSVVSLGVCMSSVCVCVCMCVCTCTHIYVCGVLCMIMAGRVCACWSVGVSVQTLIWDVLLCFCGRACIRSGSDWVGANW